MFHATSHHPSIASVLDKIKASILCLLMIFASTPNLHAQQQCPDPYETNCVVTLGPISCGNGGVLPCWIKYDLTVTDTNPNAKIYYSVFLGPYEKIWQAWVSPGQHIVYTESWNEQGFGLTMNGYMWATASGYSQSNQVTLSF
jgi:hypothetical protein